MANCEASIDHAAEAQVNIDRATLLAENEEATSITHAAVAQAHATLALAEQARIANIIAYVTHAEGLAQGHKEWLEEEMGI